MSKSVQSNCIDYKNISDPSLRVTIDSSNYPNNPFTAPTQILSVTLVLSLKFQNGLPIPPYKANVTIGDNIASYQLDINDKNEGSTSNTFNCAIGFPKGQNSTYLLDGIPVPNATLNKVILNLPTKSPHVYNAGDEYLINMVNLDLKTFQPCAQIIFTRYSNTTIDDSICDSKDCFCTSSCATTRVPIINILGQSMLSGEDTADMTFTIFDEFTYYDKKSIVNDNQNKCQLLRLKCSDLKETKFIKCCPWMVSVTKGQGSTLNEKLQYLIKKNLQPTDMGINQFLHNMIKYGMTRYILSRILYGKFNIDYLLEKYYKKFITDLGRSRFCRFLEFFENCTISPDFPVSFVGYEKYFLYDKKC